MLERAVSHHELRRGEAWLGLDGELVAPVFQVAHCHCCGCCGRTVFGVVVVVADIDVSGCIVGGRLWGDVVESHLKKYRDGVKGMPIQDVNFS
jgi:hypothetical protein